MEVCLSLALAGRQSTGYKAQLQAFLGTGSLTAGAGKIRPERCNDKWLDFFFTG